MACLRFDGPCADRGRRCAWEGSRFRSLAWANRVARDHGFSWNYVDRQCAHAGNAAVRVVIDLHADQPPDICAPDPRLLGDVRIVATAVRDRNDTGPQPGVRPRYGLDGTV